MDDRYVIIIDSLVYSSYDIDMDVHRVFGSFSDNYPYYGRITIDSVIHKGFFTRCQFQEYGFIFK